MDYSSEQRFSGEENIQGPDLNGLVQFWWAHLRRTVNASCKCNSWKSVMYLLSMAGGSQWLLAKRGFFLWGIQRHNWGETVSGVKVTWCITAFFFLIFIFQIKICSLLITLWQWWLKLLYLLYMHYSQFWKCLAPIQKILWHVYNNDDSTSSDVGCCKTRKLSKGEEQTFWRSWSTARLAEAVSVIEFSLQTHREQVIKNTNPLAFYIWEHLFPMNTVLGALMLIFTQCVLPNSLHFYLCMYMKSSR